MENLVKQAEKARKYWFENLLDEYDYILLLPENDERMNKIMCGAFERKLKVIIDANRDRIPKAVVLSRALPETSMYCAAVTVSEEIAEGLLSLYCMFEFTDKLIIGSFDLPYGRKLRNLLNSGITSETELINSVIFQN